MREKYGGKRLFSLTRSDPVLTVKKCLPALLVLYYRLFQENTHGLEREPVVREFMNYLAIHRYSLKEEDEEPVRESDLNPSPDDHSYQAEPDAQKLDFGAAGETERRLFPFQH